MLKWIKKGNRLQKYEKVYVLSKKQLKVEHQMNNLSSGKTYDRWNGRSNNNDNSKLNNSFSTIFRLLSLLWTGVFLTRQFFRNKYAQNNCLLINYLSSKFFLQKQIKSRKNWKNEHFFRSFFKMLFYTANFSTSTIFFSVRLFFFGFSLFLYLLCPFSSLAIFVILSFYVSFCFWQKNLKQIYTRI